MRMRAAFFCAHIRVADGEAERMREEFHYAGSIRRRVFQVSERAADACGDPGGARLRLTARLREPAGQPLCALDASFVYEYPR